MTGLAIDPRNTSTIYAGAADGGVWKSTDRGAHWAPVFDDQPSTAVGAVEINPADDSVWVGTGENNTAFDNYMGTGIYRSTDGGAGWHAVGGSEVANLTVGKIAFDGVGNVYAATDMGLFKHSASAMAGAWRKVLDALGQRFQATPYGLSIVNDVVAQPHERQGRRRQHGLATAPPTTATTCRGTAAPASPARRWAAPSTPRRWAGRRSPTPPEAPAVCRDRGHGAVQQAERPDREHRAGHGRFRLLEHRKSGNGPWNQIAGYRKLANSGSALKLEGLQPGCPGLVQPVPSRSTRPTRPRLPRPRRGLRDHNAGSTWHTHRAVLELRVRPAGNSTRRTAARTRPTPTSTRCHRRRQALRRQRRRRLPARSASRRQRQPAGTT